MKSEPQKKDPSLDPTSDEKVGGLAQRIQEAIGDLSLREFATRVGVTEGTMRNLLKGGVPRLDTALRIAEEAGVNLGWLATGEGPKAPGDYLLDEDLMLNERIPSYGAQSRTVGPIEDKETFDEEYALIEGYHVAVSTGHGAFGEGTEVTRRLAFRRRWLNYRGFRPDQLKVVFARGDSMEPTIKDGDSLLVNLASTSPVDGKIFVVCLGEQLYAKRIQKRWDGGLELISDNKEYHTQVIPAAELEQLQVIGQVVWIGKDIS